MMFYDKWLVILALLYIVYVHGIEQPDDVSTRLVKLESMIGIMARDRDDNERRLQAIEASARKQKSRLENELVSVQSELSTLQHKYQDLVSQIKTSSMKSVRTSAAAAKYAFFASLSNRTSHLNHNEKIVLDHVLTNDGDSYDPKTGVFTCHQPGTYVFYVTIQVEDRHSFSAEIVKNGQIIARVSAEPMFSRASSSTSVIVNLTVGDIVYIRSDGYFDQYNASIDEYFSSFSGFLIEVGGWVNFGSG